MERGGIIIKKFLIGIIILINLISFSKFDIRYGGQYYPEEFLFKGYDFFSKYGIKVDHKLFSSGTENTIALISGSVDVNIGSDSKTVALFNTIGDKAVIIAVSQRGDRYTTVIRNDSKYTDWSQLKGKKVATRFGTGAEYVLRKYFDSRDDLDWNDFEWINMKIEDMVIALKAGKIEAFTAWAPTPSIAIVQNVGKELMSYGNVALTPVQIHTTKKFLEKNRELLVRFLAAHIEKSEMIKNNPEKAAFYAAKGAREMGVDISEAAFLDLFKRIDYNMNFNVDDLNKELINTSQFLLSQGKINKIPQFYFDKSILEDAWKLYKETIKDEK